MLTDAANGQGVPAEQAPKVGVVVVNFNGLADTLHCLDSLLHVTYAALHIYIVDNGSSDNSLATLRQLRHVCLTLLETGTNLGFSGGNNLGIRQALDDGCEYVLLLNNDAVIRADAVAALVAAQQALPNLGVAQGKIYNYFQPQVIWNLGARVYFDGARMPLIGAGQIDQDMLQDPIPIDYASGCMLFVSRTVLERIGLLEDAFFFLSEDADFGMRAQAAGYDVMCIPQAVAWHKISSSGSRALQMYFTARNHLLLIKRHARWYKQPIDIFVHLLMSIAKMAYLLVVKRNLAAAKAIVLGFVDGLQGHYGRGRIDQFL